MSAAEAVKSPPAYGRHRWKLIKEETLFILGAGAHFPYDMPLGGELAQQLVMQLPAKMPKMNLSGPPKVSEFSHICAELYSGKGPLMSRGSYNLLPQMVKFRNALDGAAQQSIDDFLRTYHDEPGFPEIGRLGIAYLLMKTEFRYNWSRSTVNLKGDWLTGLFQQMHRGNSTVDEFLANNNVHFVTFNYDRTLENFFYLRILHTYNLTPEKAFEALGKIEIKHVYGSLGPYDHNQRNKTDFVNADYKQAAEGIQLMFDVRQKETDEIIRAQRLYFDHCKHIVFLGFAFDEQNIKTLKLNRQRQETTVYATRYGMTEAAWAHTLVALKEVNFNITRPNPKWNCLDFIQNVPLK
jgi:hypothetical protein